MAYAPISDYALIGDCHGAALVRRDGSIDWACPLRFDSAAIFCRLLDDEQGGSFELHAREGHAVSRRYLPNTNVLETRYDTHDGSARVLDCLTMRRGGKHQPFRQLLRIIEGMSGTVRFHVRCRPRFDYGELPPALTHESDGVYSAVGGATAFALSTDAALRVEGAGCSLVGEVQVHAGQRARFSIVMGRPHDLDLRRLTARVLDARLQQTIAWWERWVQKGSYEGEHREALIRSALTLKLLTCAPTGAVVAAPTTSLPESVGGARNWDYRYSWVRDSTLTFVALRAVGHHEVATGFMGFLGRTTAGAFERLQIMYGCYGERRLTEVELPHLAGYRGSRPVRIGNAAATQLQLDVYGELLAAAHIWWSEGEEMLPVRWGRLCQLVDAAARAWQKPDQGLWETRCAPKHFVYSKVMCWVALDRGVRIAEATGMSCDLPRWRRLRDEIRRTVEERGVDRARGCFVQTFDGLELDASLLRLPSLGFVSAHDPRMLATVRAIEQDLTVDGLVRRYRPERAPDGVPGQEGVFLMTSFWLVDVLAMQGRLDDAERLFRRLLLLGNDLGLFAEEYSPSSREQLGNFPQAFTHVALIGAATQLHRARTAGTHHCHPLLDCPRAERPRHPAPQPEAEPDLAEETPEPPRA